MNNKELIEIKNDKRNRNIQQGQTINDEYIFKNFEKSEEITDRKEWKHHLGLFILFLICGLLAVGPIQWSNIKLPIIINIIYKISIPLIFLTLTIFLYRHERLNKYWQAFYAFFVGSVAFFIAWLFFFFFSFQTTTIEGIAYTKLLEATLIVIPIILLIKISGGDMDSILIKKGNLKLGLLVGLVSLIGFSMLSIYVAEILFYGTNLTWERVFSWMPWILIFVLANGLLEEILYRGLFLKRYESSLGLNASNILTAMIYSLIHFGVVYTSENLMFLVVTFFLGLLYGFMIRKTDSLLSSILFHAGTDIFIIIGVFSTL